VARRQKFLAAEFSKRFEKSYAGLTVAQQNGVDKAVIALLKRKPTPGMRVKPIQPEKYYAEARINDGDRLIHRIDGGTLWVVDIVPHDDIDRYGRKVEALF
jgi:mRNA-degrading endonuclease RelE of RelBE toxin-antitoxin system